MVQRLVVIFICSQVHAMTPSTYPRVPFDFEWYEGMERKSLTFIDGSSIHQLTKEDCSRLPKSSCLQLQSGFSGRVYDVFYTPTRQHSNVEDFYGRRWDVITYLSNRFNYSSYLEIGCFQDVNYDRFKGKFSVAVCVDPSSGGTHRMTSDEFFSQNTQTFDIIFIDGLHEATQVTSTLNFSLHY
jgi:hypothetical protein